ncbi:MAG: hypothetical protein KC503_41735 [Myxococcales bacterium]|nr:hypothetical protein [Myxococcales bacterium]
MRGFPIDRCVYRDYPADFEGDVFICDIDRTYLATRISSLSGMARVPFEFAVDKRAIDGMTALLKEVRRGPGHHSRSTPLYFVSASPAQLRSVIERKMMIDGLEFDGSTFKDWFGVVKGMRLARFREQIGFKLTALLSLRAELPPRVRETLIGDDLESDPVIFALYADILSGRLCGDALLATLRRHGVSDDDAAAIVELKSRVPDIEGVRRAYIRLERHPDGEALRQLAPFVVPCRSALQMAASLWTHGYINADGVINVGRELIKRRYSRDELTEHLSDAARRGLIAGDGARELQQLLVHAAMVRDEPLPAVDPAWAMQLAKQTTFWTPAEQRG